MGIWFSSNARSTPMCAPPFAAPPLRTTATRWAVTGIKNKKERLNIKKKGKYQLRFKGVIDPK
jgi:hypothetical protein